MAKTIRARLRETTQSEMAARLGVSQGYVSQLTTGAREPSLGALVRIADVLGVSDRELGASAREMVTHARAEPADDVPGVVAALGAVFGLARQK